MSELSALTIVALTVVLGIWGAVAILRALRRQSYQRWPGPARWLFVMLTASLAAMGAFALVRVYLDRLGIWSLY